MAMLACARIGAVHSVVGGFAAHELATRIDDANHGSFCQPHAASRPAGLFGFAIVALGAALIDAGLQERDCAKRAVPGGNSTQRCIDSSQPDEIGTGKSGSAKQPTAMPQVVGLRSPSQKTLLPQFGQK